MAIWIGCASFFPIISMKILTTFPVWPVSGKRGPNLSEQSRGPTAGGAPKGSSSLWSRGRNERLEKLEDFLRGGDNFSGGEGEIFLVHFLFFGHHVSQKCHRMSQKKTSLRGLTRSGPEVWRAARKKNL